MDPGTAKWLVGAVWVAVAAIVGAVTWLSVLVFKIGQKYGSVEAELATLHKAGERFEKANERLDRIPVIEMKVDTLADAQTEHRRKTDSVIPEMQSKLTALWEKVFSLNEWRKSRPRFGNGNGNGHGE